MIAKASFLTSALVKWFGHKTRQEERAKHFRIHGELDLMLS